MAKQPYRFDRRIEKLVANLRGIPENVEPVPRATERGMDTVIDRILSKYKIGQESLEDRIRERWPQIVGPANAPHCSPSRIERESMLFIAVANPVIRQELEFSKSVILANIRLLEGGQKIKQVILKSG